MKEKPLRVGIVGIGAIGRTLAKALDRGKVAAVLVALHDKDRAKAEAFASTLTHRPAILPLDELIARSDVIVEAASQGALERIVPKVLEAKKDLLVLSVGGLLRHEEWFRLAEEKGCRILVPSGAIAGLDGLKAASMGEVWSVTLVSRKPVHALKGARYVVEKGIDLEALTEETIIFEGPAREACQAFPTTANVAAALSLAGIRAEKTRVKVVAVPGGSRNLHEITVEGEFGRLQISVENIPSEENPKTSKLASLSALATLDGLARSLRIGT
ncbi:MAG: aspartate dehydrogenase [candidate division NC10 bacterium]|nr:aspartate dehydrogenase [candidate division NC10 bacterium]